MSTTKPRTWAECSREERKGMRLALWRVFGDGRRPTRPRGRRPRPAARLQWFDCGNRDTWPEDVEALYRHFEGGPLRDESGQIGERERKCPGYLQVVPDLIRSEIDFLLGDSLASDQVRKAVKLLQADPDLDSEYCNAILGRIALRRRSSKQDPHSPSIVIGLRETIEGLKLIRHLNDPRKIRTLVNRHLWDGVVRGEQRLDPNRFMLRHGKIRRVKTRPPEEHPRTADAHAIADALILTVASERFRQPLSWAKHTVRHALGDHGIELKALETRLLREPARR